MQSRYLAIVVLFVLIFFISFRDKKRTLRHKLKYYGTMFAEGMVGGLIIDSIGVNAGYYGFPRQPLYSLNYWLIVIPCWGIFGMLINCLWDWFGKEKFIRSMVVTFIPLFCFYEGTNLITGSWVYHAPLIAIVSGWIPLVWTFAGCNKRRKVVHKVESLKTHRVGFRNRTIDFGLSFIKCILVVIMFPLLFVVVAKWVINIGELVKNKATATDYTEYTKMTVKTWLAMS